MKRSIYVVCAALTLGAGCKDAAMTEENARLKAQVSEQAAQLGKLQSDVAHLGAENAQLQQKAASDPLAAAQDAYIHGDYARAVELAQAQVAAQPARAWRVIGSSRCFLHDKAGAADALKSAPDDPSRDLIRRVCERVGVKP
jgi:hypothetical protein